jgi:kumamolisin
VKKALRILAAVAAPVPIVAGVVLANSANASNENTHLGNQPLVAMLHNVNPAVRHSTRMGDMPADDRMSLAVSLKLHDEADLRQFLAQVSDPKSALYHHYLTPAEFTARYGPSQADVAKVTDFLTAQGLSVKDVSANRQVVDVTGPVSQVDNAFATHMGEYQQNGREFYANDAAPTMPADVAGVVAGISGLDNHAVRHSYAMPSNARPHRHHGRAQAAVNGFTPQQLRSAYDTTSLGDGAGQTVALWEFDGYQAQNIASYDQQFDINAPAPRTVSVDGANFDQQPGQGQGEVELDVELVQAMAPAANTLVYEAPNSDQGQIDMANQIVSDDKVSVTSISWGACEAASSPATTTSTDNALQQGAAEGISFYAASGDSGSDDCRNGGQGVDYPASDPNVTGTGGTSLTAGADGAYGSETAWSGSGGGSSTVFAAPAYQQQGGKRLVPDVSLDADPNTGYAIFSAGQWDVFGGTSCAAPMWAGFTALYDAKAGANLGNGNAKFYAIGAGGNGGTAFHDITSGSNGAFAAGTGFDEVTGLGSYDGAALASALGG